MPLATGGWRELAEKKDLAVTERSEQKPQCLPEGVAHVSFPGGGIFLPARNPYDRQVLMEHVTNHLEPDGEVQVLIDGHRWLVRRRRDSPSRCLRCGCVSRLACHATSGDRTVCCSHCAFGSNFRCRASGRQTNGLHGGDGASRQTRRLARRRVVWRVIPTTNRSIFCRRRRATCTVRSSV